MTYIICEPCINEKDNAYIAVCPVECMYPMQDKEPENDIPLGWTHTINWKHARVSSSRPW